MAKESLVAVPLHFALLREIKLDNFTVAGNVVLYVLGSHESSTTQPVANVRTSAKPRSDSGGSRASHLVSPAFKSVCIANTCGDLARYFIFYYFIALDQGFLTFFLQFPTF